MLTEAVLPLRALGIACMRMLGPRQRALIWLKLSSSRRVLFLGPRCDDQEARVLWIESYDHKACCDRGMLIEA